MNNPFVGFETFTKQHTDDEHPYGEDSHLDDDSILERHGDVETDDNYYDEDDDVDLQWGKVSDAAKGAVGAAKSGASKAAKTVQSAGQAAGAKVGEAAQTAGGFAQDAAKTGIATGQAAGQAAKDWGQAAGQTAGYAAQDAGATIGAKVSDAAKTAQIAGQVAGDVAGQWGQRAGQAGKEAVQSAGAKVGQAVQSAGAVASDAAKTGIATGQAAGQAAGQKVAGAFGKSHDDMMASLDQAIGFMEKQVDTDEEAFYDEPTGNRTAVRSVERGDEDTLFDAPEYIEDFDYDDPTELNTAQREAIEEVSQKRQQGIAENKRLTAPDDELTPEEGNYPPQKRGILDFGDLAETAGLSSLPGKKAETPRQRETERQGVLTPADISTSALENRLEEEDRIKRAEQSRRTREQAAETRDRPITPMKRPERAETSDADPFAQSADNVLAKALGSVIDIMEKQDPRFRCQECGTKVPKSGRKCRKCGSEDIDLA